MENTQALHGKKIMYKREYLDSLVGQTSNNATTNLGEIEKNNLIQYSSPSTYTEKYNVKSFYVKKKTLSHSSIDFNKDIL